jgi:diguanylate cyclase (GGDEF)-like protein/PAS domain S-box-containing protein
MVLSGGDVATAARGFRLPWPVPWQALAIAAGAPIMVALAGGQGLRVGAAALAAGLVLRGRSLARGRERQVRGWIAVAAVVWLVSEIARLAGFVLDQPALLAELSVIGIGIGAIGTYVTAARGRMRRADEVALYLDALAIFCILAAWVIVLGADLVSDAVGLGILIHAAFFVAVVAAPLLLDLSTRVPLGLSGPWALLMGLACGAAGYLGLVSPLADGPLALPLHAAVAAGALLVGYGGSRWTAAVSEGRRYAAVARWVRHLLPLVNAALGGGLVITLVTQPSLVDGGLRALAAVALAVAILSVIARQTVLIADREHVIRRERELTDELTIAEAQYRSVVERVPGVVYVAEAGQHGRWHFVSPKIADLLGYTPEEWMADATMWMSRVHPADRERMAIAERDGDRSETQGRWEYRLLARDGRTVWVIDDEAVVARDADGQASMVQGILVDISDRKHLEDQLRHQALHDPLTNLPNRVLFVDRLSHALVRRTGETGVAVLFVDLDDFKAINDTLGHAAGDSLLTLVADRLSHVLRAGDTAARLGGDEFAFLLEGAGPRPAEEVAARLLAALAEPFDLDGRRATLSASIGIAARAGFVSPAAAAETADELLRDADTAMYAAKAQGKGRVQLFSRDLDIPVAGRRELRNALERALDADELFLEYQPIVDMRDGGLLGVESLIRWNHPQLGRLLPADFVPLAEESGLIGPLGAWVMRQACDAMRAHDALVSVNVSAHQLRGTELSRLVETVLRTGGLPPNRLLLELTESTLASAGAGAEEELGRVQALGVRIALDDFGSGYSSLEYLGRLPIDVLKIDRSLVERVHLEPQRQEVLRAIGHIADKLGLETIVEGVELEDQRAALLDLGFIQAQGFLFARAMPLGSALATCHLPAELERAS